MRATGTGLTGGCGGAPRAANRGWWAAGPGDMISADGPSLGMLGVRGARQLLARRVWWPGGRCGASGPAGSARRRGAARERSRDRSDRAPRACGAARGDPDPDVSRGIGGIAGRAVPPTLGLASTLQAGDGGAAPRRLSRDHADHRGAGVAARRSVAPATGGDLV